ncbi:hypothetical protein E4U17_003105 [Claviceps sp. LM77 group G4]|nr:hypothetical protein E4U17_003105 [Claviceps sp. LM77 group G4]KAG6074798.1 hypothetical protein E4U33_002309 [Claviceps sp. LM78 group G4]KAG6076421.1 hypothetical protein E4U16_002781 [Claviceps sp. LM84 group G4]
MPQKGTATTTTEGDVPLTPSSLTDNETRLVKTVFDNMAQKPDANWDRVAADLGIKDAKRAKERFRQMSVMVGETRVLGVSRTPTKKVVRSATLAEAVIRDKFLKEDAITLSEVLIVYYMSCGLRSQTASASSAGMTLARKHIEEVSSVYGAYLHLPAVFHRPPSLTPSVVPTTDDPNFHKRLGRIMSTSASLNITVHQR